jgi:molecular chaperone HtpG
LGDYGTYLLDKKNKRLPYPTVYRDDREEVDKYINQIALSSANDFWINTRRTQMPSSAFRFGFYSSFMVSKKVEIVTKSYKEDAQA